MNDFTIRLGDLSISIECEIAQGSSQKSVASTYALALMDGEATNFARANKAIIDRWSLAGLERVKTMAWKIARSHTLTKDAT